MTLVTESDLPTREFVVIADDAVTRIRDAYYELHPSQPELVRDGWKPKHRRPWFLREWWRQYRASRSTVGTGDRVQPVQEFVDDLHRWNANTLARTLDARGVRPIEARLIPSVQPMWQIDPLGSFLPPPLLLETPDFDAALAAFARGRMPELVGAT